MNSKIKRSKGFILFIALVPLFLISCIGNSEDTAGNADADAADNLVADNAAEDNGGSDLLVSDDFDRIQRSSRIGKVGDYTFEYWNQDETGDADMGLRSDGTFEIGWKGIFNMLARYGVRPGDSVRSVTYTVDDYTVTSGISYLCIYGWAYNGSYEDLVEFYIVDNWKNYRPPGNNGIYYDTVTVDGDEYDIYTSVRTQQPSIAGTRTFTQYWSVRKEGDKRLSGTIDVDAHFAAWENAGLTIGSTLYEVSFCVEGYSGNKTGTGHANVSELIFNTN